ncbi:MAG TPA: hypothetical protein VI072_15880 [Polyangiaceae bacterium]
MNESRRRRARLALRAGVAVSAIVLAARARDPITTITTAPAASHAPHPPPLRRALAVGAALVPGVLVHGSGHYVLGQPQPASKLLWWEAAGVGGILAGGLPLYFSGASRYVVAPAALLAGAGFGLFALTFLTDVYGTAAPDGAAGVALGQLPRIETEIGYRYVYDPQFRYRNFAVQGLDLRWRNLRLAPSAWFALEDGNLRARLLGAVRFVGPVAAPAPAPVDGTALDLQLAVTHHRFDRDGFSSLTAETALHGRLDFARVDPAFAGSFGEFGAGLAVQALDYEAPALSFAEDVETLLLMRFGWGVYLGSEPAERGGEWLVYYDHRHDGYAAGLKITGLGSGVLGHFGTSLRYFFDENWGIGAEAEVGSAYVTGVSGLYRYGGRR